MAAPGYYDPTKFQEIHLFLDTEGTRCPGDKYPLEDNLWDEHTAWTPTLDAYPLLKSAINWKRVGAGQPFHPISQTIGNGRHLIMVSDNTFNKFWVQQLSFKQLEQKLWLDDCHVGSHRSVEASRCQAESLASELSFGVNRFVSICKSLICITFKCLQTGYILRK